MNTIKSTPPVAGVVRRSLLARRPAAVLALAALMVASLVTAATAQNSVQLNMTLSSGTRTLSVTKVGGGALTSLTLVPGIASPYQVTVTDTDIDPNRQFTVQSETNNLYRVTGPDAYDFSTQIDSADITMGVGIPDPTGLGIDLTPVYTLTQTTASLGTGCSTLITTALAGLALSDLNQVSDICAATSAIPTTGIPVADDLITNLDLTGLLDDLIGLTNGTGGTYDDPSFEGIGAGDTVGIDAAETAGDVPTRVTILSASPTGALTQPVLDAIASVLPADATAKVSNKLDIPDVLDALATNPTLSPLASAISRLSAGAQATVLNALFDLGVPVPNLSNLTGVYTAVPALTANPAEGTTPAAYSGTHTVTLVSP